MPVTFVQDGNAVDYVPAADVPTGAVVVQGDLVGVVPRPIPAGALGAIQVSGVFDFPKAAGGGTALAAGVRVYWDVAEQAAKSDSEAGANKLVGKTVKAAADTDPTVRVRLEQ